MCIIYCGDIISSKQSEINQARVSAAFKDCIREMRSYLGQDIGYPDWNFLSFASDLLVLPRPF